VCTALGVPVITTNLSGYGSFVQKNVQDPDLHGIYVVDRVNKSDIDVINQVRLRHSPLPRKLDVGSDFLLFRAWLFLSSFHSTRSFSQVVNYMSEFCKTTVRERVTLRARTERVSQLLSWKRMNTYYRAARRLALERAFPDEFEPVD
jgi:glycogen(starch) synthase